MCVSVPNGQSHMHPRLHAGRILGARLKRTENNLSLSFEFQMTLTLGPKGSGLGGIAGRKPLIVGRKGLSRMIAWSTFQQKLKVAAKS